MTRNLWVVAFSFVVAASPLSAATAGQTLAGPAATDSATTRYCLRVEPGTGSLVERIRCWTRAEWAEQGVDVDKEWAKEGVAVKR